MDVFVCPYLYPTNVPTEKGGIGSDKIKVTKISNGPKVIAKLWFHLEFTSGKKIPYTIPYHIILCELISQEISEKLTKVKRSILIFLNVCKTGYRLVNGIISVSRNINKSSSKWKSGKMFKILRNQLLGDGWKIIFNTSHSVYFWKLYWNKINLKF